MPDVADVQYAEHVHPEIHSQEEVQYPDVGSDKSAGHQWRRGRYSSHKDYRAFPLIPGNVEM